MKTPPNFAMLVPSGTVTYARLHGALSAVGAYGTLREMHRQADRDSIGDSIDCPLDVGEGHLAASALIASVGHRVAKRRIARAARWDRTCRRRARDRRDGIG